MMDTRITPPEGGKPQVRVAVVGGGLAGLQAACLLNKAGIDFVLIEARTRPGGRILTVDSHGVSCDDGVDLGPSWFWPKMQPAIGELVAELGLTAFVQHSDGDVIFERMLREGPQRYRGVVQEPMSMRLVGGMTSLVQALVRTIPDDRVQLGTRVTAMSLRDNGVSLTLAHDDGRATTLACTHVIAALPPRLLDATVTFTPAQEAAVAQRWRDTPTWMAPHAKFFALFDRPFWREAGLSGTAQSMVGPMVEIHDATTASGQAALFGFLGVDAAQREVLGEASVTRGCLDQLSRLFGEAALAPVATLIKDWAADPLTATAADRLATGHVQPGHAPWVQGAWQSRLILAGSETSPEEPGYLAGAIIAARHAVDTLIGNITTR
ncbi:FAD-dependent oxidoreductase [Escherichia coli]|nr:FAD-dependent oxidoreductase [Escherichia coli]